MAKILLMAPGHDSRDRRVNRTLEAIESVGHEYRIVYESKYRLPADTDHVWTTKDYMSKERFLKEFRMNFHFDYVWIHDSGLFGLELVRRINRWFKDADVIFDYHDWIEWEVYYQIKKRGILPTTFSRLLYWIAVKMLHTRYRNSRITYLIGISKKQIKTLERNLSLSVCETVIVSNTRMRLPEQPSEFIGNLNDGILWIGNVMRGRDLEKLASFMRHYNRDTNRKALVLYIIGRILSKDLYESLSSLIKVEYLGEFNDDYDIAKKIDGKNVIGFYYGWIDSFNTGINSIASPNKVYSMLNLQVPLILGSELRNMFNLFTELESIQYIQNEQDFAESVDFFKHKQILISNKGFEWEDKMKERLENLLHLLK